MRNEVYIDGQVSSSFSGQTIHAADQEAQICQVCGNLEAAVKAAGDSLTDIVMTTMYVVVAENLVKIRPALLELLPRGVPPALPYLSLDWPIRVCR